MHSVLTHTHGKRQTRQPPAAVRALHIDGSRTAPTDDVLAAPWPQRPDTALLSETIRLFFISRDSDGFWVACDSQLQTGGIFLLRRSALKFARRRSEPTGCALMFLEEPHNLEIQNQGNRLIAWLRPAKRLLRRVAAKAGSIGARLLRACIEHRVSRAALEAELYRGRYKHSSKNDDDLPIVAESRVPRATNKQSDVTDNRRAWPVAIAFAILAAVMTGLIALRAMIGLPTFQR
jgi:hypothetical protein